MASDGYTRFLKMMRSLSSKQFDRMSGVGTFDIGAIGYDGSLRVSSMNATVEKGAYLVNNSILPLDPGDNYLIAFVNNRPAVLCRLGRG